MVHTLPLFMSKSYGGSFMQSAGKCKIFNDHCKYMCRYLKKAKNRLNTMSLALSRFQLKDLLGTNFILKSPFGVANTPTLLVSPTKASVNF